MLRAWISIGAVPRRCRTATTNTVHTHTPRLGERRETTSAGGVRAHTSATCRASAGLRWGRARFVRTRVPDLETPPNDARRQRAEGEARPPGPRPRHGTCAREATPTSGLRPCAASAFIHARAIHAPPPLAAPAGGGAAPITAAHGMGGETSNPSRRRRRRRQPDRLLLLHGWTRKDMVRRE